MYGRESNRKYGLAGFLDPNGKLGRPIPTGQILVPTKVWREGDKIRWRGNTVRYREASPNMLTQFVRLSDAESVLCFAKEWGPLALSDKQNSCPGHGSISGGAEPIAAWLCYARRARSILNIAAALKDNKLGDLDDWNQLGVFVQRGRLGKKHYEAFLQAMDRYDSVIGFTEIVRESTPEENLARARGVIGGEVDRWLDIWKGKATSGVSDFSLRWSRAQGKWNLEIDYHGLLFAAIALQLALVIADADSLYSCCGCGVPYIRSRERKRPKKGWANFCDQCAKEGVAGRRAGERYREKKKQAVQMHSGGLTPPQIAKRLNTDTVQIHSWLKK